MEGESGSREKSTGLAIKRGKGRTRRSRRRRKKNPARFSPALAPLLPHFCLALIPLQLLFSPFYSSFSFVFIVFSSFSTEKKGKRRDFEMLKSGTQWDASQNGFVSHKLCPKTSSLLYFFFKTYSYHVLKCFPFQFAPTPLKFSQREKESFPPFLLHTTWGRMRDGMEVSNTLPLS